MTEKEREDYIIVKQWTAGDGSVDVRIIRKRKYKRIDLKELGL